MARLAQLVLVAAMLMPVSIGKGIICFDSYKLASPSLFPTRKAQLETILSLVRQRQSEFQQFAQSGGAFLDREAALERIDNVGKVAQALFEKYPLVFDLYVTKIAEPLLKNHSAKIINFILLSPRWNDFFFSHCWTFYLGDLTLFQIRRSSRRSSEEDQDYVLKNIEDLAEEKGKNAGNFFYLDDFPIAVDPSEVESTQDFLDAISLLSSESIGWLKLHPDSLKRIKVIELFPRQFEHSDMGKTYGRDRIRIGLTPSNEDPLASFLISMTSRWFISATIIHEAAHLDFAAITKGDGYYDEFRNESDIVKIQFPDPSSTGMIDASRLLNELYAFTKETLYWIQHEEHRRKFKPEKSMMADIGELISVRITAEIELNISRAQQSIHLLREKKVFKPSSNILNRFENLLNKIKQREEISSLDMDIFKNLLPEEPSIPISNPAMPTPPISPPQNLLPVTTSL